jgi:hypothetical protein
MVLAVELWVKPHMPVCHSLSVQSFFIPLLPVQACLNLTVLYYLNCLCNFAITLDLSNRSRNSKLNHLIQVFKPQETSLASSRP